MDLKLATLNLCFGLKCKKIEVENLMISNNIDMYLSDISYFILFQNSPNTLKHKS